MTEQDLIEQDLAGRVPRPRMFRLPGVYRPQEDFQFLPRGGTSRREKDEKLRKSHPLYFSSSVESSRARRKRECRAKELCTACPVVAECRRHAITVGEEHGVWGGMTAPERRDALLAAATGVGGARYERRAR